MFISISFQLCSITSIATSEPATEVPYNPIDVCFENLRAILGANVQYFDDMRKKIKKSDVDNPYNVAVEGMVGTL